MLINLKSKETNTHFFKAIEKKQKTYIFIDEEKKVKILLSLKDKKQKKKFLKDYYLLESPHFKEEIPTITLKEANNDFFIP